MEHREQADRLEREAEKMEQESERVGGRIDQTRGDWETKEADQTVPGAQPDLEAEVEEELSSEEEED